MMDPMNCVCPNCLRRVENRRLAWCAFCGEPIPEAVRLTGAEIAALDRRTTQIERRNRERDLAEAQAAETAERARVLAIAVASAFMG